MLGLKLIHVSKRGPQASVTARPLRIKRESAYYIIEAWAPVANMD